MYERTFDGWHCLSTVQDSKHCVYSIYRVCSNNFYICQLTFLCVESCKGVVSGVGLCDSNTKAPLFLADQNYYTDLWWCNRNMLLEDCISFDTLLVFVFSLMMKTLIFLTSSIDSLLMEVWHLLIKMMNYIVYNNE